MVFHGVSCKDSVTIVSESEYVAQKTWSPRQSSPALNKANLTN